MLRWLVGVLIARLLACCSEGCCAAVGAHAKHGTRRAGTANQCMAALLAFQQAGVEFFCVIAVRVGTACSVAEQRRHGIDKCRLPPAKMLASTHGMWLGGRATRRVLLATWHDVLRHHCSWSISLGCEDVVFNINSTPCWERWEL